MLELQLTNKKVQMLSIKELLKIPLIECSCGKEFGPLPDTYVDGKPYCTECRMRLFDSKLGNKVKRCMKILKTK